MMLQKEEVDMELAADTKIFHFGTLSMTHEGVRAATMAAVAEAKQKGALISFDPICVRRSGKAWKTPKNRFAGTGTVRYFKDFG